MICYVIGYDVWSILLYCCWLWSCWMNILLYCCWCDSSAIMDLLELLVMVAIIGVIWCNFSLLFFFGRGVISVLLEFGDPLEFLGLLLCFGCIFSLCYWCYFCNVGIIGVVGVVGVVDLLELQVLESLVMFWMHF